MNSGKIYITWDQVFERLEENVDSNAMVYGLPKGGMIAAGGLKHNTFFASEADIILDDLVDSGATKKWAEEKYPHAKFVSLFDKKVDYPGHWIVFPWEAEHPSGEDTVQGNITRQLQYLGENPDRDGLIDTPNRVVKSWEQLFSGYHKDPKDIFKVFDSDGYDEIVVLKNIEFYSMCEHHMLPFHGKAHIAYIANGKVIGISKLARLLDIFARRLQIQERISQQVVTALNEHLNPLGAACIIEAQHMCMTMRGVGKQNSIMTTSSLTGRFRTDAGARNELMNLIK